MKNFKKIIKENNLSFSKKLGQNFLIDDDITKKIINLITWKNNETILEIGPGIGALTQYLVIKFKQVIAYEMDLKFVKILKKELPVANLTLLNQDFLKANFLWKDPKNIIGNIPYSITSKILFKIFENWNKFSNVILMLQEEVVNRLIATPHNKKFGKLTLAINLYAYDIQKKIIVDKDAFLPKPQVQSAIITFKLKKKVPIYHQKLLHFFKQIFLQRRKNILNNLKGIITDMEKTKNILTKLNLKFSFRPEDISYDDMVKLFLLLDENNLLKVL